jgi:hypothetical protein
LKRFDNDARRRSLKIIIRVPSVAKKIPSPALRPSRWQKLTGACYDDAVKKADGDGGKFFKT